LVPELQGGGAVVVGQGGVGLYLYLSKSFF